MPWREMNFFKDLFGKEKPINSYEDFWNWFRDNQAEFHRTVESGQNIEKAFLNEVLTKLSPLSDGLFVLAGKYDSNTVELVITPDGDVTKIVFAEEVVAAAPLIDGWRFTALKPECGTDFGLRIGDYEIIDSNLQFVSNESLEFPDEVDVSIIYEGLNETNRDVITNGIYLFIDNLIGELDAVTKIDDLDIIDRPPKGTKPFPINELRSYLEKRESSFTEKYSGIRRNTDDDAYIGFEGQMESGLPIVGIINASLLKWDSKASHPWLAVIEIDFDGRGNNGLPDEATYGLLDNIENDIVADLNDYDGYLNVGRQTGGFKRHIYFACKDFRKPSKKLAEVVRANSRVISIDFKIYKDKYWRTLDRFVNVDDLDNVH